RHGHRLQALDGANVPNRRAIGPDERIALPALDAADGQLVLVAQLQPELPGMGFHADQHPAGGGDYRISGGGPRRREILLICHSLKRLTWACSQLKPSDGLWF